jgi:hypothetical protein
MCYMKPGVLWDVFSGGKRIYSVRWGEIRTPRKMKQELIAHHNADPKIVVKRAKSQK